MTHDHADRSAAEPSIDIAALRHRYPGGHQALDGVDLTIGTGVFGLLGPNGAGKSTLMRILCTLLEPSEGHVRVCGYDVRRDRRAIRSRIGYLPQQFGAWRLHRVEEVLDTLARLSGMRDAKTRRARVAAVLQEVGLSELAHRKVKTLSGGMVRRLGVAQALIHEPRVLVVDEPTVGLDPQERIRFRQLMSGLGRDRIIVLSTHIVADLGAGCRDLALLDAGQVLFHGPPSDLIRRAAGQVFEATVPLREADAIEGRHEIVSRSTSATGGQVTLRGVAADGRMPSAAAPASDPTLEEAYLAFMASRGRTTAARQEAVAAAGRPAKEVQ